MCGNGVVIGLAVAIIHQLHQPILPGLLLARIVCVKVVVGIIMHKIAECRIATAVFQRIEIVISVFDWFANK